MIRLAAPAKINLSLDILHKRPDGFHELVTVMQAVSLSDELRVEPAPELTEDVLLVDGPFAEGVPTDERNLVRRAFALLRAEAPLPWVRATLTKNIPHGAGLGGGSSDGVAGLLAAAMLQGREKDTAHLEALAAQLGSDCPFFVRGGTQVAGGRGERLQPLARTRKFGLLLVVPPCAVPTGPAYEALDPGQDFGVHTDPKLLIDWLRAYKLDKPPALHNAFQRSVRARFPEVDQTLAAFAEAGAEAYALSGSGSACFGLWRNASWPLRVAETWNLPHRLLRPVRPVDHGVRPFPEDP